MPDPVTGDRERVAREALLEITGADTIGDLISETVETDAVITIHLASLLDGYPGWHWSVSLAELPGEAPSVLEVELMPGEGALLAPEWVPWSDRLPGDDDEGDEDEEDDDLDPDEIDDGIDFETDDDPDTDDPDPDLGDDADSAAVPHVGVEQHDESETEADESGPEPPSVPAVKKRWQRKKKTTESE